MNKDFLERIYDSLSEMIGYADDGMISRNDPEFSEFFASVDTAREVLEEVGNRLEEIYDGE